ncbi:MBL fold metallo-hydrolase [Paludibacterium purpuratum]|uniref:Glyoxylase-like metal-dependent hydrolase (Beta-lactamase superfamily II) n=1 Tax=Paludibacterium purpuratum TaxID=1144873 RepID=A0A4R7AW96_9NEIS|nr:MBL fold metallo-hydrolase [Paludibacterium purpuratum]TDR71634.1 glyoxylase-like metal-dependent hydrolase (beta-lactamase superfamily II) [Paludibacterium purpuratum]
MLRRFASRSIVSISLALGLSAGASAASSLHLQVYNPGEKAFFPVASVLVSGARDAVLIDAQFGKSQAEQLVQLIRQSGKRLTAVYISHGDPDYYFGLETIKAAFPDARIVATAPTVAHIRDTAAGKLAYWGPKLGVDAPKSTVTPEVLPGNSLMLEGHRLEVRGLNGKLERSYVWIPDLKAVVGGVVLFNNLHVWMADTQSPQSHADWLATLAQIRTLEPRVIVPGHALPGAVADLDAPDYTAGYIRAFDAQSVKAASGDALIAALRRQYPQAGLPAALEIGARVAKGEMKW